MNILLNEYRTYEFVAHNHEIAGSIPAESSDNEKIIQYTVVG
jgi:hypothetical protein